MGERTNHISQHALTCGAPLDTFGADARKCGVGGSKDARHDASRDFTAKSHKDVTDKLALKEQHVIVCDLVNPKTGELEEARLDVCTRDAVSKHLIYIDVMITCAHSIYGPRHRARSNNNGMTAMNAVDKKRDRYPPSGGELVPLVFEAGGRTADETVAFVRA